MPRRSAVTAEYGENMIRLSVRFWTNDIADGKGNVLPKHGWTSGVVKLEKNSLHGIRGGKPVVFRGLLEIGSAIEKALIAGGIQLHPAHQTKRYLADGD
jgi:hypothetical protein